MINEIPIVVYSLLALACSLVLILTLRKKNRRKLDTNLIFVAAMLLLWQLNELFYYLSTDFAMARFFFDMKLPFVALVSLSWFLYIIRFYGLDSYIPAPIVAALLVVPVFTCALAITSADHGLIRSEMIILQTQPTHEYLMSRGPWFWAHSAYCYGVSITAFCVAVRQHLRTPKAYRLPSTFLICGVSLTLLANVVVISMNFPIDLSLVGGTISAILLYFATKNYQGLFFLINARNEAFNYLDKGIFILDGAHEIVRMNRYAQQWVEKEGILVTGKRFQPVLDQIAASSVSFEALEDEEGGTDYRFASGRVFNYREKPFFDNEREVIGYFAFISDETDNRRLIRSLDEHSGLDALTGLSNRRKMEEDIERFEQEGTMPLTVMMGDLNNLKETNDALGHQQGDVLLRMVAETLKAVSPPGARIARMGGDEFVILLANYDEQQAESLVSTIKVSLDERGKDYAFDPSIALGYATKVSADQSVTEMLNRADENMYVEKRAYKRERESMLGGVPGQQKPPR